MMELRTQKEGKDNESRVQKLSKRPNKQNKINIIPMKETYQTKSLQKSQALQKFVNSKLNQEGVEQIQEVNEKYQTQNNPPIGERRKDDYLT